jgi:hypothetical protein
MAILAALKIFTKWWHPSFESQSSTPAAGTAVSLRY